MRFELLGGLAVFDDGGVLVPVVGPSRRGLLAVLLLHAGEVLTADRLIDELWGQRAPPTAAKSLQVHVWRLRRALDGGGGSGQLATEAGGYVIRVEPGQLDLEVFEGLLARGRAALADGHAEAASAALSEALSLWHGQPLAEFADQPFAREARARLDELRLEAVEARIDADLRLGRHRAVIAELESLIAANPLRERLRSQLMLALYRSGRQADALAVYRETHTLLDEQLGLEPGSELRALERAVLAHDPSLEVESAIDRTPVASAHDAPESVGSAPAASLDQRGPPEGPYDSEPIPQSRSSTPRRWSVGRRGRRGALLICAGGAVLLVALAAVAVDLSSGGAASVRVAPNSVAAIDTASNRVVAAVPVGTHPDAIAFGSGSLWVANVDDQSVSRVDPSTLRTTHTLFLTDPPTGLAAGASAIWVIESDPAASDVTVNSVDPQFDDVRLVKRLGNIVAGGPGAVGTRGATLWVAPSSGLLTRLDPTNRRTLQRIDPNSGPTSIAIGSDAVWLTDSEANNVTRVDPTGLLTPIAVGNGPTGIAVGDGGVWVVDSLDNAIVRIDPNKRAVTTTIQVGRSPTGIAVGAGSIWVANGGDGTVDRVDPETGKVLATIAVGGSPQAITVADGRAWVTVDAQAIGPATLASSRSTLRMDAPYDVDSMDPALAYTTLSAQLLYATCAKLLNNPDTPGAAGSQLTAEVAQSLPTRSTDGRTYTFTIRTGFRFSPPSNRPVTAQTFKHTIERTLNPRMHSPVAQEFNDIIGSGAYMLGKSPDIKGVVARGDTLTIRLRSPEPDFLARIAEPAMCAVPSNTPADPKGLQVIPSAGPYYVNSYTPGQAVVLLRNPNYRGNRPHRLGRIELAMGISNNRAVEDVKAGRADYVPLGGPTAANISTIASQLAARYGSGSSAAAHGRQQYFVKPGPALNLFYLNTHRPLFSDVRMREAVNYAIDRHALARIGNGTLPLPERPTDDYLPPGIPGSTDAHVYPLKPNPAKAKSLAQGRGRTAMLYTCEDPTCTLQAQVLKNNLKAIGLQVDIKEFPIVTLQTEIAKQGGQFDLASGGWNADYPDPTAMLNTLLNQEAFDNPTYQRRLADAARLTGPQRYIAYGKLDVDLARRAAPLVAIGDLASHDFFSTRTGCQTYGFYGADLAALCIKHHSN
jgi:YVTN family beta-propeller protein